MKLPDGPVLLFDGDCPFCNRCVSLLLKWDKDHELMYAPQASKAGQWLAEVYQLREQDEIWLYHNNALLSGEVAVMATLKLIGANMMYRLFSLAPQAVRKLVYSHIATNRKQLAPSFICEVPANQCWTGQ